MTAAELEKLLADVPASGLLCLDYTSGDFPGWYITPGNYFGSVALVPSEHGSLAQLFALSPTLARKVIAAEKLHSVLSEPLILIQQTEDWELRRKVALAAWEASQ